MPILGCREHHLMVDSKEVSEKVVSLNQQRLVNMSVQKSLVWRMPDALNFLTLFPQMGFHLV